MSKEKASIFSVVHLNKVFENLYEALIQLELDGKENTEEYQDMKKNIALVLKYLRSDYLELEKDPESFIDQTNDLYEMNGLTSNNYVDNILELKPLNRVIRTLLQTYYLSFKHHIYTSLNEDEKTTSTYYFDDDDEDEDEIDMSIYEEEEQSYLEKTDEIEVLKETLIAYRLYDKVIKMINKETDPEIKNELIKLKYNLIFSFIPLEELFISYDEIVPKTKELYEELLEKINILNDQSIHKVLRTQITMLGNKLAQFTDADYEDKLKLITIKLNTTYLKTLLKLENQAESIKQIKQSKKELCKQLKKEKKTKTRKLIKKTYNVGKK